MKGVIMRRTASHTTNRGGLVIPFVLDGKENEQFQSHKIFLTLSLFLVSLDKMKLTKNVLGEFDAKEILIININSICPGWQ